VRRFHYYGQEDRDKEVFLPLTVTLRTGDIGLMDLDFFKIIDRRTCRYLSRDLLVFPNELENVISTCPESSDIASVSCEQQGESIKVFIVKTIGA
jgi:acyl-CoA synthetase (AMP-forming)/AMP-acid ligase II